MGVDWYACAGCNETYPDCSYYFTCSDCERGYCSDGCGGREVTKEADQKYKEETSCIFCRGDVVDDAEMVAFLLGRLDMTRDEAIALWKAQR